MKDLEFKDYPQNENPDKYKKLSKEFKEVDLSNQLEEHVKNLGQGKIKIKTKDGLNIEASVDPKLDFDKTIKNKSPEFESCKFKIKLDKNFESQDIKIKTSINGKIKDNKLDKADFTLDFTKDLVNQDVQIFVNIGADLVTFKSPAGEKDFTAYFGATKKF